MKRALLVMLVSGCLAAPAAVFAAPTPILLEIYEQRKDLQQVFDSVSFQAIPGSRSGFLIDLEDWARQYGWREYTLLDAYAPVQDVRPKKKTAPPPVTAKAYLVMDWKSGLVLSSRNAEIPRSIASLTKLVTADIVLDSGVALSDGQAVLAEDDVGGAKLYVSSGEQFTLDDLLYATLAASANNAANAIARASGLDRTAFIEEMNRRVQAANLSHTRFVEPSGMDPENKSTAREIARLAEKVFARSEVRQYTSSPRRTITAQFSGEKKEMINTNWLLRLKRYNDVYVTAGKTGYLEESAWNVVTTMRPKAKDEQRELLVVVLGSGSRRQSFDDADRLAQWTWKNWKWETKTNTPL